MKLYYAAIALGLFFASCAGNKLSEETLKADAQHLATLQCEAKKLQEERFQLANDIRMLEDSIMIAPDSISKQGYIEKLAVLTPNKEDVGLRTKTMADSISRTITALQEGTYKDTADRKLLDAALLSEFERLCK